MGKMAITINSADPKSLYPAFIMGTSAAASGDDVILFFEPYAAAALKKGLLESIKHEGMPVMEDLVEGVIDMGGRIMMCELALKAGFIKEEELREDVEIVGVTNFIVEAEGSQLTFSF
jgi:predicted peroxiredoxin